MAVRCVGLRGSAGTGNNQLIADLDRRQSADVYKDADGRTSHTITHRINMKTFLAAVVVLAVFATAQV